MKATTKTTPAEYADKMKRRKPAPKKGKSRRNPEAIKRESHAALLEKIDRWQMATANFYAAGNILKLKRRRLHNEVKAARAAIVAADVKIGEMALEIVYEKRAVATTINKYSLAMDALALACKVSVHKPEFYLEKAKAASA